MVKSTMIILASLLLMVSGTVSAQSADVILNFPYYDATAAVAACGSSSLVGEDNTVKAFNFFVSKDYEPFQAAGIVGNMMYESGVLPQRLQGTAADVMTPASEVGDRVIGWGIVQWTPGSKMISPVTAEGKDPNDLAVQLDFLWNQLEGNGPVPEKRAGDEIKGTTNVEEAVKAFQGTLQAGGNYYGYERPADQSGSVAERTQNAINVLAQAGSGGGDTASGVGCGGLAANGCPTEPIDVSETVTVAGNIKVHPCISAEVERIIALANQQGLNMSGGGYRDQQGQIDARIANCGGDSHYNIYEKPSRDCEPPTAPPGTSRHETGTAVDFTCGASGGTIPSRSHPCFVFLDSNTSLKNLDSEPWHWSDNGE